MATVRNLFRFFRRDRRTEECCECGRKVPAKKAVVITEEQRDDARLGITNGGTIMSASYCRKHGRQYVG